MRKKWDSVVGVVMVGVGLLLFSNQAGAKGDSMLKSQILSTITKTNVKNGHEVQREGAKKLFQLTLGINLDLIDDETITNIASVLDNKDEEVRYWTARSLGNLGPRAIGAAPKLKEILIEVERIHGSKSKSSASGIRFALSQMGETPPPQ